MDRRYTTLSKFFRVLAGEKKTSLSLFDSRSTQISDSYGSPKLKIKSLLAAAINLVLTCYTMKDIPSQHPSLLLSLL